MGLLRDVSAIMNRVYLLLLNHVESYTRELGCRAEQIAHELMSCYSDSGANIVLVSELKRQKRAAGDDRTCFSRPTVPHMTTTNFEGEGGYPPQLKSGDIPVSTHVKTMALK